MAMNWLSYQRLHISKIAPHSFITMVGTQRQSLKEIIRGYEPRFERVLVLDSVDPTGILTASPVQHDASFYSSSFTNEFFSKCNELPQNSLVVVEFSLLPTEAQPVLREWLTKRRDLGLTFFIMFPQTYSVPLWVAEETEYVMLHRVTGNEQAYRLFGTFFPDILEFCYAIEQYAKFYECLVIDNILQKAWWFRPYHL